VIEQAAQESTAGLEPDVQESKPEASTVSESTKNEKVEAARAAEPESQKEPEAPSKGEQRWASRPISSYPWDRPQTT
jgi:hypothetical protein